MFGLLIAGLWQGTGFVMCIMLAGLRGVDEDIWKAARVDGIPAWKTYLFIVVPMMRPVFITTLVIVASALSNSMIWLLLKLQEDLNRKSGSRDVCVRLYVHCTELRAGACLDHDVTERVDCTDSVGLP